MTRIVVAGAGSIGCFVGGLLEAAGWEVGYLGRGLVLEALRDHGLAMTDFTGMSVRVTPRWLSDDPQILAQADLILVTVKSGATAEMARLIAAFAPPDAPVLSLQNGIDNARLLAQTLPDRDLRAGMVPFNVVPRGPGRYHRATSGEIVIARGTGNWAARLSTADLPFSESAQIEAVQWGKLVLNLTNAVNALSGLRLRDMLEDRAWRRLMADQMAEALAVLAAAGLPVALTAPVPMRFVPWILRLPTPLFRRVAAQMLTIDPEARTSMAYDLEAGRVTEVDHLQGAILDLAQAHGMQAPCTQAVFKAIKAAEGQPSRPLLPTQIRMACSDA